MTMNGYYRFRNYKYKPSTGKVYKKVLWFFWKPVNDTTYHVYIDGVKAVNNLAGADKLGKGQHEAS